MRVLIVEDDAMIGESMQAALRDADYSVDWALDGESALSAFGNHTYDLVLLDLGLPKKAGSPFCARSAHGTAKCLS